MHRGGSARSVQQQVAIAHTHPASTASTGVCPHAANTILMQKPPRSLSARTYLCAASHLHQHRRVRGVTRGTRLRRRGREWLQNLPANGATTSCLAVGRCLAVGACVYSATVQQCTAGSSRVDTVCALRCCSTGRAGTGGEAAKWLPAHTTRKELRFYEFDDVQGVRLLRLYVTTSSTRCACFHSGRPPASPRRYRPVRRRVDRPASAC
jgi:hypothetical protein